MVKYIFQIKIKDKKYIFFPFAATYYSAIFVLIFFLGLFILDRLILPSLEVHSLVVSSPKWRQENSLISYHNTQKVKVNPVWRSKGHSVVSQKTTSKRILVMGDSFVWGDGYANMNDLWWRQLQLELLRRGYRDIEVIASGKGGWNTKAQLESAKDIIPVYKPDLVIWGYVTNDPDQGYVRQAENQQEWNIYVDELKKNDRISRIISCCSKYFPFFSNIALAFRQEKLIARYPPLKEIGYNYTTWELKILEGENFGAYYGTLKRLKRYMASAEIPFFFVTLPNTPNHLYFKKRYEPVFKLFEKFNIPYYDLLPEFIEHYGGDKRPILYWGTNPANGHPGFTATRFYATQVANILEQQFPDLLPDAVDTSKYLEKFYINDWSPINMPVIQKQCSLTFVYPKNDEEMLKMPYSYPYVQFNLEIPIMITKINLHGDNLSSAILNLTFDDPDDLKVYSLGQKSGNNNIWHISGVKDNFPVKTIMVNASFSDNTTTSNSKTLYLSIKLKGA
jgi:hypothetical protein